MSNGDRSRRRAEKPTVPAPSADKLLRAVMNRAMNIADEAAKQLLELGRHKPLADLARLTIDYQSALEQYRAHGKAQAEKKQ